MTKLSEKEWMVLEQLWEGGKTTLGGLVQALYPQTGWSRNTVLTYLSRMEAKGMIHVSKEEYPSRYLAAVSREECQSGERERFLKQVYKGSTKDLVAAFLREKPITEQERDELRRLLDEMEV